MEVRIRLQKAGKSASKRYNYRIVAISRASARQGRNLETLGYYDPAKKPADLSIKEDKLQTWIDKGAQMTDTVKSLVKKNKKSAVK
jgi:small subunit ribosomal protein S16